MGISLGFKIPEGIQELSCENCNFGIAKGVSIDWSSTPVGISLHNYPYRDEDFCSCPSGKKRRGYSQRPRYSQTEVIRESRLKNSQQRLEHLFGCEGVPEAWENFTLKGYIQAVGNDQGKASLIEACKRFYRDGLLKTTDGDMHGIFAYGNSGVGKTGALTPLFGAVSQGKSSLWISYLDLLSACKDFDSGHVQERIKKAQAVDVLFLDELGNPASKVSEYARDEVVFSVIKARHEAQATTFVTSNLHPDAMRDAFGERTWRRLFQLCAGVLVAGDPIGGISTTVEF